MLQSRQALTGLSQGSKQDPCLLFGPPCTLD